jgi:hypothetical protein
MSASDGEKTCLELYVRPAEVLLGRAVEYYKKYNVADFVRKHREAHNNWKATRNRKDRPEKKPGFVAWIEGLKDHDRPQIPNRKDGFYLHSGEDKVNKKTVRGIVGIAAAWDTVEEVMVQHAVGPSLLDRDMRTKPAPLTMYDKQTRVAGVHIANLEPSPFDGGVASPEQVEDLAKRLAKVFPYADEIFSEHIHVGDHLRDLNQLLALEDAEYSERKSLFDSASESSCAKCGLTCAVAAHVVWEKEENMGKLIYFSICRCLFCGPAAGTKLCPVVAAEQLSLLTNLVKSVKEAKGSVLAGDGKEGESAIEFLTDKKREGSWVEDFMTGEPRPSMELVKQNIEWYYSADHVKFGVGYKFLQILAPNDVMPPDAREKQLVGKALCSLKKKYCSNSLLASNTPESDLCGILLDADSGDVGRKTPLGWTRLQLDPVCTVHLLFEWEDEGCQAKSGPATWLIVAPWVLAEALDSVNAKLEQRKHGPPKLEEVHMHEIKKEVGDGIWVVEQAHGQVVHIPVGYAYAVANSGRNFKITRDFVPQGSLHRCVLSHKYLCRKMGGRLTNDFAQFMVTCTERLLPVLKASGSKASMKRWASTNPRTEKRQKHSSAADKEHLAVNKN